MRDRYKKQDRRWVGIGEGRQGTGGGERGDGRGEDEEKDNDGGGGGGDSDDANDDDDDDDNDGVTHRLTVGSWTNGTQLATHRLETNALFYVKTKSWFYFIYFLYIYLFFAEKTVALKFMTLLCF